ncbi:sugar phosphate nucleotidyltransferase [Candidatus Pelagibacter ubique]|nr:sugar phosphate nucleotidyltransferase [Candidatus Pelagibacter ubique]
MKIVILCGGKGTRLGFETKIIPKPMAKIDKDPIIMHIINYYKKFGYNDFILALGHKGSIIKNHFKKKNKKSVTKIKCINTGINTLTGTRLLKLKKYLSKDKNFMLTYGDGLTNQNLNALEKFHIENKKIATMTIVRPPVRFGEVKLRGNLVKNFKEKPQIHDSWINGGFFVFSKDIFKFLGKENEMLEKKPLEKLSKKKQIIGFKHLGFWQCMDTPRDKEYLIKLLKKKIAPWKI